MVSLLPGDFELLGFYMILFSPLEIVSPFKGDFDFCGDLDLFFFTFFFSPSGDLVTDLIDLLTDYLAETLEASSFSNIPISSS